MLIFENQRSGKIFLRINNSQHIFFTNWGKTPTFSFDFNRNGHNYLIENVFSSHTEQS